MNKLNRQQTRMVTQNTLSRSKCLLVIYLVLLLLLPLFIIGQSPGDTTPEKEKTSEIFVGVEVLADINNDLRNSFLRRDAIRSNLDTSLMTF